MTQDQDPRDDTAPKGHAPTSRFAMQPQDIVMLPRDDAEEPKPSEPKDVTETKDVVRSPDGMRRYDLPMGAHIPGTRYTAAERAQGLAKATAPKKAPAKKVAKKRPPTAALHPDPDLGHGIGSLAANHDDDEIPFARYQVGKKPPKYDGVPTSFRDVKSTSMKEMDHIHRPIADAINSHPEWHDPAQFYGDRGYRWLNALLRDSGTGKDSHMYMRFRGRDRTLAETVNMLDEVIGLDETHRRMRLHRIQRFDFPWGKPGHQEGDLYMDPGYTSTFIEKNDYYGWPAFEFADGGRRRNFDEMESGWALVYDVPDSIPMLYLARVRGTATEEQEVLLRRRLINRIVKIDRDMKAVFLETLPMEQQPDLTPLPVPRQLERLPYRKAQPMDDDGRDKYDFRPTDVVPVTEDDVAAIVAAHRAGRRASGPGRKSVLDRALELKAMVKTPKGVQKHKLPVGSHIPGTDYTAEERGLLDKVTKPSKKPALFTAKIRTGLSFDEADKQLMDVQDQFAAIEASGDYSEAELDTLFLNTVEAANDVVTEAWEATKKTHAAKKVPAKKVAKKVAAKKVTTLHFDIFTDPVRTDLSPAQLDAQLQAFEAQYDKAYDDDTLDGDGLKPLYAKVVAAEKAVQEAAKPKPKKVPSKKATAKQKLVDEISDLLEPTGFTSLSPSDRVEKYTKPMPKDWPEPMGRPDVLRSYTNKVDVPATFGLRGVKNTPLGKAVNYYGGNGYSEMNRVLRGVEQPDYRRHRMSIEAIAHLDEAVSKWSTPRRMAGYRVIEHGRNGTEIPIEQGWKVGDIVRDPGYASFSVSYENSFASLPFAVGGRRRNTSEKNTAWAVVLDVPAGLPGVYTPATGQAQVESEYEIIPRRDLNFEVVQIDEEEKAVWLRVLPMDQQPELEPVTVPEEVKADAKISEDGKRGDAGKFSWQPGDVQKIDRDDLKTPSQELRKNG